MGTTSATVSLVEVHDHLGRLLLVPAVTLEVLRQAGEAVATFCVPLSQLSTARHSVPANRPSPANWLTLKVAAARHLDDVDTRRTIAAAKSAIHRAIANGRIRASGNGNNLRIDPESLDVWRLKQRERNLARADS